jgi:hypothetical protein
MGGQSMSGEIFYSRPPGSDQVIGREADVERCVIVEALGADASQRRLLGRSRNVLPTRGGLEAVGAAEGSPDPPFTTVLILFS